MDYLDEARKLAAEHPDLVQKVVEKTEQLVDEKTDHQYTDEIRSAGDEAQRAFGVQPPATPPAASGTE